MVVRLRCVRDRTTGERVDTWLERAECVEEDGEQVRWRLWTNYKDNVWRPSGWVKGKMPIGRVS